MCDLPRILGYNISKYFILAHKLSIRFSILIKRISKNVKREALLDICVYLEYTVKQFGM